MQTKPRIYFKEHTVFIILGHLCSAFKNETLFNSAI